MKEVNIKSYRGQFERLKMKENDNIASYFLCVDEIANIILGLRETVPEEAIV